MMLKTLTNSVVYRDIGRNLITCLIFLAVMLVAGCAKDDPVVPVEENGFWETIKFPGWKEYLGSVEIDDNGTIYMLARNYRIERMQICISERSEKGWGVRNFPDDAYMKRIKADHEGNIYGLSNSGNPESRIYRSSDNCDSWQEIALDFEISRSLNLLFDSQNGGFIISSTGIFCSDDCCNSWEKIFDGYVHSIAIDSEDRLYAAMSTALLRSSDSGENWSQIEIPLTDAENILRVAVDTDARIFVLVKNQSMDTIVLYRSMNNGENWEEVYSHTFAWKTGVIVTSDNTLFCYFSASLYRSIDNGTNWTQIYSGYLFPGWTGFDKSFETILDMKSSLNGDIVLFDEDINLYRSCDNGENWVLIGMPHGYIYDFAIDSRDRLWVALYNGVYFTDGNFSIFHPFNKGLINPNIHSLIVTEDGSILAGTLNGIYKSSISDTGWTNIGLKGKNVYKIYALSINCITVYCSNEGVFQKENGAEQWEYLGMHGYYITSLLVDGSGDLYAGTAYGGVFRYTGVGEIWEQLNLGFSNLKIYDLKTNSEEEILACTGDGLYYLDKTDSCWIINGLEDKPVKTIYITECGDIYAASDGKVLRKKANSSNWEDLGEIHLYRGSFYQDNQGYLYINGGNCLYKSINSVD